MNPPHTTPLPEGVTPLRAGDPMRIADHSLLGRLGSGGMGTVYAAVSPDGACVALKLAHDEAPAGFDREFELMDRIQGEYAVGVHAHGTFQGRRWAAIDYLPGRSLHRHVRDDGPWTDAALLVLLAGCAEALAAVHRAGIAHGDVKPGNLIVTPDGPRLIDYGIARLLTEPTGAVTAGSPGWLAPERYAGAPPEPASDVFAWGCLAHFAATGQSPFGKVPSDSGPREALAEMARRSRQEPADLSTLPEGLADLVLRTLAPEPEERPSAEQVYQECLVLLDVPREVVTLAPTTEDEGEFWENMLVRMRALVAEYWPRVDVSWHRPALWASAAVAAQTTAGSVSSAGPLGTHSGGEGSMEAGAEGLGETAVSLLGEGGKLGQGMGSGAGEAARGSTDALASALGGGTSTGGAGSGGGAMAAGGASTSGTTATTVGTGKVVGMIAAGGVAIGVVAGGAYYFGDQVAEEEPATSSAIEDADPTPEEADETLTHVLTLEDSQDPDQVQRLADALQEETAETFVLEVTVDPGNVNTALWPLDDGGLGSTPHDALVLNSDCWDPDLDCDSALVLYFLDGYDWQEQEDGIGFAKTFRVDGMGVNDEEWLGSDWIGAFPGLHVTLEEVPE